MYKKKVLLFYFKMKVPETIEIMFSPLSLIIDQLILVLKITYLHWLCGTHIYYFTICKTGTTGLLNRNKYQIIYMVKQLKN